MSRDALIVGINQYQALPELKAAAKDAEGIANLLETHGDFRVRRLPEIIQDRRPQIDQQTRVLAQQLEASLVRLLLPKGEHIPEAAFFYFSGHGLQREIGIREGYLATSDTQPNISTSGLSLSWLRRLIKHSPIRQIVVILDCCHSGEFLSLKDEAWQGRDGQSYLFIAASREYEEAYESLESDYSVLTQAVISGLLPQQTDSGRVTSTDLIASITNRLRHEIQQPLFEQGGSEIVITQQSEHSHSKSEGISVISRLKQYSFNFCPYRGPYPFEEKHAHYYFGREPLIQELLQALQQTNLCAVIGASGSGKTSLLRAGLIPRLTQGKDIIDSEHWLLRYVSLGREPLKDLATAFTIAHEEIDIANQLQQAEALLRHTPTGLVNLATAALLKQPTAKKFWLVIDQFEELLIPTTDPKAQQERHQLITALITALRSSSPTLGIIISLRSDALDSLTSHHELFSLVEQSQVVISPMNYQAIRDVIEKPAEKLGLKIDPHLVHNLTLDLTGAPGELALLQSTLYELWQYRTPNYSKGSPCILLDSYINLGRLSKILTNKATAFYQTLPSEEQVVARRILTSLCNLGDGCLDQCRRARKSELANQNFLDDVIERVLQKLIAARLIVSDKPQYLSHTKGRAMSTLAWKSHTPQTSIISLTEQAKITAMSAMSGETIELAHKSLISDWHLLRQWLHADRNMLKQRRDIEERAWIWHQRGESKCSDYLLRQQYLSDISQFLSSHASELSTLAQRFVRLSQRSAVYQLWRTRGIAVLLPLSIMAGMTTSLIYHQLTLTWRTHTRHIEKSYVDSQDSHTDTSNSPSRNLSSSNTKRPNSKAPGSFLISPQLPQKCGMIGTNRIATTSQILYFRRKHPETELSQISVTQLANLMTPDTIVANSSSLPDTFNTLVNDQKTSAP